MILIYSYSKNNKEKFLDLKGLPTGDWRRTCRILNYVKPHLWAVCYDDKEIPHDTFIDLSQCYKERIRNTDGKLECY